MSLDAKLSAATLEPFEQLLEGVLPHASQVARSQNPHSPVPIGPENRSSRGGIGPDRGPCTCIADYLCYSDLALYDGASEGREWEMAQPNSYEKAAEYEVAGTPQTILPLVRDFFESEEWEWSATSFLYGPGVACRQVGAMVRPPLMFGMHPALGFLLWTVLSVLTLGSFTVLWFCWRTFMLLFAEGTRRVQVKATQVDTEKTRLVVETSGRQTGQYVEPVAAFIERELVGKRAAAF